MSGFLGRLVARTIGQANVVRPRPVPPFAVALDLPNDSSESADASYAASHADSSQVKRFDGQTILHGRTYAERERPRDTVLPSIEGPPAQRRVEQKSPAAFLKKGDADDMSAREEPRVDLERISTLDDAASIRGEGARAPRTMPSVTAREDAAHGFPEENRIAAPVSDAVALVADTTERRARTDEPPVGDAARTRRPRVSEPDDRFDLALTSEIADPSPLAPMLAGPGTGVRESESIRSRATADRVRSDAEPEPETTIVNVTIGRIEVRPPAETPARTFGREAPASPQPRDQLDAYLRARSGSKR